MNKKLMKFDYFVILAIVLLSIAFTERQLQNDTYYSIAIGRDILKYGVDMIDHYSIHNLSYTYPHWLFDLCCGIIYLNFGFDGLYVASILMYILIIGCLYYFCKDITGNLLTSAFFSLLALLFMHSFIVQRGQIVSYLVFIIEIYLIEKYVQTNKKGYLFPLPVLSVLLVNCHCAVWPMFFVFFMPTIGEYIVAKYLNCTFTIGKTHKISKHFLLLEKTQLPKRFEHDSVKLKPLIIAMLACLPTGMICANGITTPYTYIFKTLAGTTTSYISEHQPPIIWGNYTFIFILLVLFVATFVFNKKFKLRDFFLLCGCLILAFSSQRHKAFLIIASTFVYSRYFSQIFATEAEDFFIRLLNKKLVSLACAACLLIGSAGIYYINSYGCPYVATKAYPESPCDWIENNLDIDNLRMYNEYAMGPYILFRGIPVFIDTRCDLYTSEYNGLERDIFNDMVNFNENYRDVFDYYDLDYALIRINYLDGFNSSYQILKADIDFDEIYNDGYFAIFQYKN